MTREQLTEKLKDLRRQYPEQSEAYRILTEVHDIVHWLAPHVLTLDEAELETAVWLEYNGILRLVRLTIEDDALDAVAAVHIGSPEPDWFSARDYGRKWRCWNAMPDEATRKEAPWNAGDR